MKINISIIALLLFFGSCTDNNKNTPTDIKTDTFKLVSVANDELFLDESNSRGPKKNNGPKHNPPPPPPPPPPAPIDTTNQQDPTQFSGSNVFYVDFNAGSVVSPYWNNGEPINATAANMSEADKDSAVIHANRIWRAFDVVFTRNKALYDATDQYKKQRIIVTDNYWRQGASGWNYNGAFFWGDGTPAWVFSGVLGNSPKYVGDIIAHEAGHGGTLNHQTDWDANCQLISGYRNGVAMGSPFSVALPPFTVGTTYTCTTIVSEPDVLYSKFGARIK